MEKNKVKVTIAGSEYILTTEDDPEYTANLAAQVNDKIAEILSSSSRLSVTQAAILCSLDYADAAKRVEESADNLRSQIQDYLEDAAKARTDAEIAKREADRLSKELDAIRRRNG